MIFIVNIFVACLLWSSVRCDDKDGHFVFYNNSTGEVRTLLHVTWKEAEGDISVKCTVIRDSSEIDQLLDSLKHYKTRWVSPEQMQLLLEDCTESSNRKRREVGDDELPQNESPDREQEAPEASSGDSTTAGYDGIPVIFPGTKWCGAGDRAKNYDDLGFHQDTDRCCRAHDLCNDTLAPGETRKNLTNKSPFTKLSCKCDMDFYDCLARVNTVTSNTIGNTYFNILKRECYREDYPLTKKCIKYRTFLKLTCAEYKRDTSKPKVNQWVPAKKYKKIPFPGPLTITIPF